MPTGYAIEPMRARDIPAVVEIERLTSTLPWPADAYRRELRNPNSTRYLVARQYLTEPVAPATEPARKPSLISRVFPFLRADDEAAFNPANAPLISPNPVVGYGGLWMMMDEAHVTTLAVTPTYQGKSLGEFLMIGLIDVAIALGASWVTLEVRVSNTVAQNLYKKYTFKEAGRRRRYYTDNDEDAFIMWSDELTKPAFQKTYRGLKNQLLIKLAQRGELAAPTGQPLPIDPSLPLIIPQPPAATLLDPPPPPPASPHNLQ